MSKKQLIGLAVAAVLFISTGVISVFSSHLTGKILQNSLKQTLEGGYTFQAPDTEYIAIIRVEGVIQEQTQKSIFSHDDGYQHDMTIKYINCLIEDSNNKGILLYVDSPGGSVYESDELYCKLMEYKTVTERPIWDYMAHYAASGGYYISVAADRIYANPNTVTGSIGVIMTTFDLTGLYEKLGIEYISISSGKNKDSSHMTDEQKAIYQSQIDESYEHFVEIVSKGRGMSRQKVKSLADGRVYTAKQAVSNGLVDEISFYEDLKDKMADETGITTFYEMKTSEGFGIASLLGLFKEVIPQSETQTLERIAKQAKGGLQYYADIQ